MITVIMRDAHLTVGELKKELELFPDSLRIRWDGCCERSMQLDSLSISKDGPCLVFDFFAPIG